MFNAMLLQYILYQIILKPAEQLLYVFLNVTLLKRI